LALFYAAIGDGAKARDHAARGYKIAWGDGPPFAWHWDLEKCRAILREAGAAEPVMLCFEPMKIEPLSFEPAVRAMLARHTAKQQEKDGSSGSSA
jgi:hypothetical protein